jgi:hypothetical protein
MMGMRSVHDGIGLVGVLLAFGALALTGCGSSDGGATGQLQVALTDGPGPYASVVVSIKEIRVVQLGDGNQATGPGLPLIKTFDPPLSIDVLTLSFVQQVLGTATVPAGGYEQVRLVLEPNPSTGPPVNYVTLLTDPSTRIPLVTPSGQQSGLKIVGHFEVTAGTLNAIVLDFNPEKAIVVAGVGSYLVKPTGIRIVQLDSVLPTFGSLSGNVLPGEAWPSATVSVTPAGALTPIASGLVSPDDGSFVAYVPEGNDYTIQVAATGYEPYDSGALTPPVTYDVLAGVDTAVGALTLTPLP